ncbi:hypothetical protein Q5P01_005677 [Channa striata]|uniref:Ribonuclease A-domain domain-containing protein n=1 Tax=Channa striata TaxID=64152 RepID=A0AA88NGV3_CHASR|nr:hypothetical protein Q5P01_005677 [Channa striata]
MRIVFVCVLLVLLCVTQFSAALTFFQKHVKAGMTSDQCRAVMRQNRRYYDNGQCKRINSFIPVLRTAVNRLCANGDGNRQLRINYVVDCVLRRISRFPNCLYTGQTYHATHATILCRNGRPVHLAGVSRGQRMG